ncbi:hypothetical protein Tco_1273143 [Tanacetum coccineum]
MEETHLLHSDLLLVLMLLPPPPLRHHYPNYHLGSPPLLVKNPQYFTLTSSSIEPHPCCYHLTAHWTDYSLTLTMPLNKRVCCFTSPNLRVGLEILLPTQRQDDHELYVRCDKMHSGCDDADSSDESPFSNEMDRGKIKKLEIEMWNLKSDHVKKYVGGLSDMISSGSVEGFQPNTMQGSKKRRMHNDLVDQKVPAHCLATAVWRLIGVAPFRDDRFVEINGIVLSRDTEEACYKTQFLTWTSASKIPTEIGLLSVEVMPFGLTNAIRTFYVDLMSTGVPNYLEKNFIVFYYDIACQLQEQKHEGTILALPEEYKKLYSLLSDALHKAEQKNELKPLRGFEPLVMTIGCDFPSRILKTLRLKARVTIGELQRLIVVGCYHERKEEVGTLVLTANHSLMYEEQELVVMLW